MMPKVFLHRQATLGLILGLGVGLSVLATSLVSRWETSNRQLRFQRQTENLAIALQRSLNRYTDLLAFLGDDYGAKQAPIDRQTFARFVGRSLQTYPDIQALEWAPLVQQPDRLAYEQTVQADGYPRFNMTELERTVSLVSAAQRPSYMPVTYVEPWKGNESALGYDLNSDATRSAAIAQARDIAIRIWVRTGCRGSTPGWGRCPHSPFDPDVLSSVATAISGYKLRSRVRSINLTALQSVLLMP